MADGVAGIVRAAAGVLLAAGIAMVVAGCGSEEGGGTTATTATTGAMVARTYRDPVADVTPGQPDLTAVRISGDARTIRFAFRFASAPPLGTSAAEGWTDMLLMGIDVPPIGAPPTPSGWVSLDYALGMHGVDDRAVFRAMQPGLGTDAGPGGAPGLRALRSRVNGREIRIELPRALIGEPAYFTFQAATGREGRDESGEGDSIPDRGTLRYPPANPA